jgi:phosphoserine phosphatase
MTPSTDSSEVGIEVFVFDIDGTLADTRPLVKEAYRLAGVEMPDHVWGQPWHAWLYNRTESRAHAVSVHTRKTEAYLKLLATRPPRKLPAVAVAQRLIADGHHVQFITGASSKAARAVLDQCQLSTVRLIGYGCTATEKIDVLRHYGSGLYVDDDLRAGQIISRGTSLDFLHANHTDPRRMMEDVQTWMQ